MPLSVLERERTTNSVAETRQLGAWLGSSVFPGAVIGLQGDLGAGKTNFVQGLAQGMQILEAVNSPTFILANEYNSGRLPLYHIDAYRVENAAEALGFGLDDYLNGDGVTVVEWAERVRAALPQALLWINFEYRGENERHLRLTSYGQSYVQLLERLPVSLKGSPIDVIGD